MASTANPMPRRERAVRVRGSHLPQGCVALTMFITTPTMFYVMRFLLGGAEAGFFPGIILYLTYWFLAQQRGRMTSLFMTAIALSGRPINGWIMDALHTKNGWQWLLLLEGIPSIIVGIVVFLKLDGRISEAKWLTQDERDLLARNITADNVEKEDLSIGKILSSGKVWLMSLIYFSFVMGLYGVSFWLPTIIKSMGGKMRCTSACCPPFLTAQR